MLGFNTAVNEKLQQVTSFITENALMDNELGALHSCDKVRLNRGIDSSLKLNG